jgi:hypothetical protein
LVLPIPPGLKWSDEMPVVLPRSKGILPVSERKGRGQDARGTTGQKIANHQPRHDLTASVPSFAPKKPAEPAKQETKKPKRQTVKNDPKLVACARELRDRWLDRVNSGEELPQARGKYCISSPPRHAGRFSPMFRVGLTIAGESRRSLCAKDVA